MTYMVQINDEVREATPDEAARIEAQQADADALAEQIAAQQAAKESARAKLAALGLTDEEINAFVGI
jgi:hypothetical protein